MENQMETAHPSVLEAQLEDLKRLLEGSAYCSGSVKPAPDDGKVDRCAELTETIATLQQQIQELTAIKSDAQGQRQNAAMTGTYYELRCGTATSRPPSPTLHSHQKHQLICTQT